MKAIITEFDPLYGRGKIQTEKGKTAAKARNQLNYVV